jgi:hypothetical protein
VININQSEFSRARGGGSGTESFSDNLRLLIERRRGSDNPEEFPDEDNQLDLICEHAENYLTIDASEGNNLYLILYSLLTLLEAAHLVAIRGFMPLHKAIFVFSKLRFVQSFVQVFRCTKSLPLAYLPEIIDILDPPASKKEGDKTRRRKSMIKVRHPESPSDSSSTEKSRHADGGLDFRTHYNVTINVNFLNSRACPFNLGFDHSPNMDVRIMNVQRRALMERLVSNCHFMHKMAPTLQRTVKTSAIYDTRNVPGTETCASLVIVSINRLLAELNVQKANEMPARTHRNGSGQFLTNLLNFFWDFQGCVIGKKNALREYEH